MLRVLAADARIPNNALAERVGIAPSTCLGRVRALRERGVIRGYHADIDPAALGRPIQAMIAVRLQSHARGHIPDVHGQDRGAARGAQRVLPRRRRRLPRPHRRDEHREPARLRRRQPQRRSRRRAHRDEPDLRAHPRRPQRTAALPAASVAARRTRRAGRRRRPTTTRDSALAQLDQPGGPTVVRGAARARSQAVGVGLDVLAQCHTGVGRTCRRRRAGRGSAANPAPPPTARPTSRGTPWPPAR